MEVVAQLVRASVCGIEGRGFETPHPPSIEKGDAIASPFLFFTTYFSGVTSPEITTLDSLG